MISRLATLPSLSLLDAAAQIIESSHFLCVESSKFRDDAEPTAEPKADSSSFPSSSSTIPTKIGGEAPTSQKFCGLHRAPPSFWPLGKQQKQILSIWSDPEKSQIQSRPNSSSLWSRRARHFKWLRVTSMLLELDTEVIWKLIDSPETLKLRVREAEGVILERLRAQAARLAGSPQTLAPSTSPTSESSLTTNVLPSAPPGLGAPYEYYRGGRLLRSHTLRRLHPTTSR